MFFFVIKLKTFFFLTNESSLFIVEPTTDGAPPASSELFEVSVKTQLQGSSDLLKDNKQKIA